MVRNLVDNAINYTPSSEETPGVITVRLLADKFGKVVVLQVEDSGPGIPEAERDLVFQPFYRALGTEADGSGLGLPIVMEIAHQHAAVVTLEDAFPGKPMPLALACGSQTRKADLDRRLHMKVNGLLLHLRMFMRCFVVRARHVAQVMTVHRA